MEQLVTRFVLVNTATTVFLWYVLVHAECFADVIFIQLSEIICVCSGSYNYKMSHNEGFSKSISKASERYIVVI